MKIYLKGSQRAIFANCNRPKIRLVQNLNPLPCQFSLESTSFLLHTIIFSWFLFLPRCITYSNLYLGYCSSYLYYFKSKFSLKHMTSQLHEDIEESSIVGAQNVYCHGPYDKSPCAGYLLVSCDLSCWTVAAAAVGHS